MNILGYDTIQNNHLLSMFSSFDRFITIIYCIYLLLFKINL